ncbi:uncharacterized protein LOC128883428 isoform X2 [Hylaeus volcanicus]|uniref:uncharacterized protein LOC128883428 isoform X2 n=1 Tax=Hylaeus volcanicus TaxID=313075 RepID=UPI0023B834B0|nr:uncharacterized protein LOC128883428 isoform X2 [Hylaeus volcanicus]
MLELPTNQPKTRQKAAKNKTAWAFGRPKLPHRQMKPLKNKKDATNKAESSAVENEWLQPLTEMTWSILDSVRPSSLLNSLGTFETDAVIDHHRIPIEKVPPSTPPEFVISHLQDSVTKRDSILSQHQEQCTDSPINKNNQTIPLVETLRSIPYVPEKTKVLDTQSESPTIARENLLSTQLSLEQETSIDKSDTLSRMSFLATDQDAGRIKACEEISFSLHEESDKEVLSEAVEKNDMQYNLTLKKQTSVNETASTDACQVTSFLKNDTSKIPITKALCSNDSKDLITKKFIGTKENVSVTSTNSSDVPEDTVTDKHVATPNVNDSNHVKNIPPAHTSLRNTPDKIFEKEYFFFKKVLIPSQVTSVNGCKHVAQDWRDVGEKQNDQILVLFENSDRQSHERPTDVGKHCSKSLSGRDSKNIQVGKNISVAPRGLPSLIFSKNSATSDKGVPEISQTLINDKAIFNFLKLDNKVKNRPELPYTKNLDPLPSTVKKALKENFPISRKQRSPLPNEALHRRRSVALVPKNQSSKTGFSLNIKQANTFLTGRKSPPSNAKSQHFPLTKKFHFLQLENLSTNNSTLQKQKLLVLSKNNVFPPPLKKPVSVCFEKTLEKHLLDKKSNHVIHMSTKEVLDPRSKGTEVQSNPSSLDKIAHLIVEPQEQIKKPLRQDTLMSQVEQPKEESNSFASAATRKAVVLTKINDDVTFDSQTEASQDETDVVAPPTLNRVDIGTTLTHVKHTNEYSIPEKSPLKKEDDFVRKVEKSAGNDIGACILPVLQVECKSFNRAHHQGENADPMLLAASRTVSEYGKHAHLPLAERFPSDAFIEINKVKGSLVEEKRRELLENAGALIGSVGQARGFCTTLYKEHESPQNEMRDDAHVANKDSIDTLSDSCKMKKNNLSKSFEQNTTEPTRLPLKKEKTTETSGIPTANQDEKMSKRQNLSSHLSIKQDIKDKVPECQASKGSLKTHTSESFHDLKMFHSAPNILPIQTAKAPLTDSAGRPKQDVLLAKTFKPHALMKTIGSKKGSIKSVEWSERNGITLFQRVEKTNIHAKSCSENMFKNIMMCNPKESKLSLEAANASKSIKKESHHRIGKEVHPTLANQTVPQKEKQNINLSKILKEETIDSNPVLLFAKSKGTQDKVRNTSMELKEGKIKDFNDEKVYNLNKKAYYEHSLRDVPVKFLNGLNENHLSALENEKSCERQDQMSRDINYSDTFQKASQLKGSVKAHAYYKTELRRCPLREIVIHKPIFEKEDGKKCKKLIQEPATITEKGRKQDTNIDLKQCIKKKMEQCLLDERKFDNEYKKLVSLLETARNSAQLHGKERNSTVPVHAALDWIALARFSFFSTERVKLLPRELLWIIVCIKKYGPSTRWSSYQKCVSRKFYQRLQLNSKQQDHLHKLVTDNLENETVWSTLQPTRFFLDL